jgi:hypothetical protein
MREIAFNKIHSDRLIKKVYHRVMGDDKVTIMDMENIAQAHARYTQIMRQNGHNMNDYWAGNELPVFIAATPDMLSNLNIHKNHIIGRTVSLRLIQALLSDSFTPDEVDKFFEKAGIFGFMMMEGLALVIKYPQLPLFGNINMENYGTALR